MRLPRLGRPGIPGSNDLEAALRRLTVRNSTYTTNNEIHNNEDQRNANIIVPRLEYHGPCVSSKSFEWIISIVLIFSTSLDHPVTHTWSVSPSVGCSQDSDSLMSCDSTSSGGMTSSQFPAFPGINLRIPERLQIVKPMEGMGDHSLV